MAVDYESMQIASLNDTLNYFNNFTLNQTISLFYSNITVYICDNFIDSTTDFAGFTDK
jgi:hypothetical protein